MLPDGSFLESLLAASLAALPLVYIAVLFRNIGELQDFSIRLPSDVYLDGMRWVALSMPAVFLVAYLGWRARFRAGVRTLVFFYAGVGIVLAWLMVWERADLAVSAWVPGSAREAMLFGGRLDSTYRGAVKAFFYGGAFLLGLSFLATAPRTAVLARRAVFLGLPSMLLYLNMLFALGDWNFLLDGIRVRALETHHYGVFRAASRIEAARVPASQATPYLLDDWAELEFQSGRDGAARTLLERLGRACGNKPWYARLRRRAESETAALDSARAAPGVQLDLPVIKPASYLDQEWYSLLSAAAFLKPAWTDLELKKRLLDLSGTIQLRLPELENIPQLYPVLRQLDVPVSACFLDAARLRRALAEGKVPFISLYGNWVPVSGYDPRRDGFYYYDYRIPPPRNWLRNEDIDLFYSHPGRRFGSPEEKSRTREVRLALQKFIPRAELLRHIVDVGGIGLVLGDSAFVPRNERLAAYLVEQGDVYYQDHGDYPAAAAAYRKAGEAFSCVQIDSRKLYLKRRYAESESDPGEYRNLLREHPPAWFADVELPPERARAVMAEILRGALGEYLMVNWYAPPAPDAAGGRPAGMDSALSLFRRLAEINPDEPLYVDSLAALSFRAGDLPAADSLYSKLAEMYPAGNEYAYYRLAWIRLKRGKVDSLRDLLARCGAFAGEARYLTMQGAAAMRRGRWRTAFGFLDRSLKLDKSIAETHSLLARWYERKGGSAEAEIHRRWQRRSS